MPIRYKYRFDNSFTENIFKKGKIWLSKPETLNDPFDCKIVGFTDEYKKKVKTMHMRQQLEGFVFMMSSPWLCSEIYSLNSAGMDSVMEEFKKASTVEEKFKIANDVLKSKGMHGYSDSEELVASVNRQMSEAGIFCLTESCTDMLMWSHYGQEHQGVCLGFDNIVKTLLPGEQYRKVIYSEKFPSVDITQSHLSKREYFMDNDGRTNVRAVVSFHDTNLLKALAAKSLSWAYEKEWRLISKQSGERDIPGKISEIVFGMKCPVSIKEKYISLAKKHLPNRVIFKEIIPKEDSFTLKAEKLEIYE